MKMVFKLLIMSALVATTLAINLSAADGLIAERLAAYKKARRPMGYLHLYKIAERAVDAQERLHGKRCAGRTEISAVHREELIQKCMDRLKASYVPSKRKQAPVGHDVPTEAAAASGSSARSMAVPAAASFVPQRPGAGLFAAGHSTVAPAAPAWTVSAGPLDFGGDPAASKTGLTGVLRGAMEDVAIQCILEQMNRSTNPAWVSPLVHNYAPTAGAPRALPSYLGANSSYPPVPRASEPLPFEAPLQRTYEGASGLPGEDPTLTPYP